MPARARHHSSHAEKKAGESRPSFAGKTRRRARPVLLALMAALTLSCASTRPAPPRPEELDKGRRIAESALALVGTPYRFGGETPAGFDCSGLIRYVYGRFGYDLPRATGDQIKVGRRVDEGDLLPGDLVFFKVGFWKTLHAGIYIGDGRFVHAPKSGGQVEVQRLDRGYYQDRFLTARRVIGSF